MPANESTRMHNPEEPLGQGVQNRQRKRASRSVTEARARAQRARLDAQADARQPAATKLAAAKPRGGKPTQQELQAARRANTTIARAIEDYLLDHEGGNHSAKTLEWHRTALGQMRVFLEEERDITLVGVVDAPDITAWFAAMRKTPSSRGKAHDLRNEIDW